MIELLLYGVLFTLVSVGFWLPGFVMERTLFRDTELGDLVQLARFCLGLAFWIVILFLLGALGLLQLASVLAVAGLLVTAGVWVLIRFGHREPREGETRGGLWTRWLPAGLLAVLLAPLFVLATSPAVAWDSGTYHLTIPKLFIENLGFREIPFNVYSNWPLNVELLYSAGMLVRDYILAKLIHFGFGLLTLYAILVACRRHFQGLGGWLAVILFLANGVVITELSIAYVDLAQAFFFLAAFLFVHRASEGAVDRGPALLLAGLGCGILAGIKFTGITFSVIVGILYLVGMRGNTTGGLAKEIKQLSIGFVLPVLALWLPWLIKSWVYTGNPVYPFLYQTFGGPDWSPELTDRFIRWQSSIGMGRGILDYLLLPVRVILCGGPSYGRFHGEIGPFWIAVLPLSIVAAFRNRPVRRCLGAAGLGFVFWSLSSQQMRFLIPVLPLLAIAAVGAFGEALKRLPSARMKKMAAGTLLSVAALALAWGIRDKYPRGAFLIRQYQVHGKKLAEKAIHPAYRFINQNLPEDAKILLLNTNQGFFCDREYLADSFFEASQVAHWLRPADRPASLARLLREREVTHVLVFDRDWGIAYPPGLQEFLQNPDYARVLYRAPKMRYLLFELKTRASSQEPAPARD